MGFRDFVNIALPGSRVPDYRIIPNWEIIRTGQADCGFSPENPLRVTVELAADYDGSRDRMDAALPLSSWKRGARASGNGLMKVGRMLTGKNRVVSVYET